MSLMDGYDTPAAITSAAKKALRQAFPTATFRVSTHYGIEVEWRDDGPTVEQVQNALLGAKLATSEQREWDDQPYLKGPSDLHYHLDRFNLAQREAAKADFERRMREAQAQRLREEEAVTKAAAAKSAVVPPYTRPIVFKPASDPTVFAVFEELRQRAEVDVSLSSEAERQRRPSWAPPLIIEGELLEACRELGYLSPDDKPIVRLWAQFADPKKKNAAVREQHSNHPLSGTACRGFELHAGGERGPTSSILFEAQRAQSGEWRFGPRPYRSHYDPLYGPRAREWSELIRKRERATDPSEIEKLTREITEIDAKDLEDRHARRRREDLRQRVIELARARVLDFAGAPGLQMQAASRLWSHCFNCGKELTDPISLERGIGPDCFVGKISYIHYLAPYLGRELPGFIPPKICTVERIVFWAGMPLEFVQATIDEMPVDAEGRRVRPEKKQPKLIDDSDEISAPISAAAIITGIDDVTLVDKPVEFLTWRNGRHVPEIRHEPRAQLCTARRVATMVLSNVYGDPFGETGWLVSAVSGKAGADAYSRLGLSLAITPPGKRKGDHYQRSFPGGAAILMWGAHDISLAGLPELTTSMQWHCPSYAATWQEVSRRCRATGQVWLETTTGAIEHNIERQKQRLADQAVAP